MTIVWRSHTHEREARGSGVKLDCDLYQRNAMTYKKSEVLLLRQNDDILRRRMGSKVHVCFMDGRGVSVRRLR